MPESYCSSSEFGGGVGYEATDTHTCGVNTYHAHCRMLDAGFFETVIRVTGSRKAYALISRYSRA
jgi:hypothetical protein